jgi:hypothetical protein
VTPGWVPPPPCQPTRVHGWSIPLGRPRARGHRSRCIGHRRGCARAAPRGPPGNRATLRSSTPPPGPPAGRTPGGGGRRLVQPSFAAVARVARTAGMGAGSSGPPRALASVARAAEPIESVLARATILPEALGGGALATQRATPDSGARRALRGPERPAGLGTPRTVGRGAVDVATPALAARMADRTPRGPGHFPSPGFTRTICGAEHPA